MSTNYQVFAVAAEAIYDRAQLNPVEQASISEPMAPESATGADSEGPGAPSSLAEGRRDTNSTTGDAGASGTARGGFRPDGEAKKLSSMRWVFKKPSLAPSALSAHGLLASKLSMEKVADGKLAEGKVVEEQILEEKPVEVPPLFEQEHSLPPEDDGVLNLEGGGSGRASPSFGSPIQKMPALRVPA